MKRRTSARKPFKTVTRGSVTIPIYRESVRRWARYRIVYYDGDTRTRQSISDPDKALARAEVIASRISNQTAGLSNLTPEEYNQLLLARQELRELKRAIPAGATFSDLLSAWNKLHPAHLQSLTVPEVVAQFIQAKSRTRGDRHIADLESRLNRFAKYFHVPITTLVQKDLDTWLDSLKATDNRGKELKPTRPISLRSRNNYRAAVVMLCNYAQKIKALSADFEEHKTWERADTKNKIETYTPEEMLTLLQTARALHDAGKLKKDLVPYLATGAFAGPRSSELRRMDWVRNYKFESDRIVLDREPKTKTYRRRQVPIQPNLRAWLTPYETSHGPICPYGGLHKVLRRLARECGLRWKHNALRHSYISYRVASGVAIEKVADECGNSTQDIQDSYLDLFSKPQAQAWFNIYPIVADQKILPLYG